MSAVDEIRQAVARLRDTEGVDGHLLDSDSRELLDMVRVLLRAREPLADLLDAAAVDMEMCDRINSRDPHNDGKTRVMHHPMASAALAVARAVNGQAQPGYARGGLIADHVTGRRT